MTDPHVHEGLRASPSLPLLVRARAALTLLTYRLCSLNTGAEALAVRIDQPS